MINSDFILDYPNDLRGRPLTKEEIDRINEMHKKTKELIRKYKPIIILNGKEYRLGNYK